MAWPLRLDPDLPQALAKLLQSAAATRRAVAFAGLVAAVADLVRDSQLLPAPEGGGGWRWQAAPDPEHADVLEAARAGAASAAVFWSAIDADADAEQFVTDLVTAIAGPAGVPGNGARERWRRWSRLVTARRAAGVRLSLHLRPPAEESTQWQVEPRQLALDPTGEAVALKADAADGDVRAPAYRAWQRAEHAALGRAWPGHPKLPCELTAEQVLEFVDAAVPRLLMAGVEVSAPDGLLRAARLTRRVSAEGTGHLGVDALRLQAKVAVDDDELTAAELAEISRSASDLVQVRGRWVRLDRAERARLARLLSLTEEPLTAAEVIAEPAFEGCDWDPEIFGRLAPARRVRRPAGLRATLRHYQRDGLDWLTWIEDNSTGGILADDMGLGKTLQVLTRIAADHAGPTLVVCPVTLVDTWLRQSAQFTPKLRIRAHHGSERASSEIAEGADVVVTTYGLLARDLALADIAWHRVVLDEAQAIKNPDTRAARAARALTARHRLAVTGTPVENHVTDLWSLMAFASPGLLPRRAAFRRRFGSGADGTDLALLRAAIAPFVLRRVKSDPTVAPELPDREVVRDDCVLTPEQVTAYQACADAFLTDLSQEAESGGVRRRAAVLGALLRLKQICVHPGLPTGRVTRLAGRSGKVERLVELCREIVAEGQAVVVFTQFASFAQPLVAHLADALGVPTLTLTGADSRSRRARVVDEFSRPDGPPVLVASIKAGGTGLTLVRANHVVHLDRWWNPAVEDQASDRVWRIGQGRQVLVHNLVCPGTLEDRIDEMLQHKRMVAGAVVTATEAAVTELSAAELGALVRLSGKELS